VLTSIPIISPIEITLGETVLRLPPPDYEIQDLAAPAVPVEPADESSAAAVALDDIERAARISEYHDFSWWDERIRTIRAELTKIP